MTPERWRRVEEIYHAALDLSGDGVPAFLDQACASDDVLRKQVEALLHAHAKAGDFLDGSAMEAVAGGAGPVQTKPLIGTQISHYKIRSLLGSGGMGEVYEARDTRLDRSVAIKVLPRDLAEDRERIMRFEREAKVISQLNHPHVCALYDIGNEKGIHYLVMELVEGETLAERIAREPIPVEQALPLFDQIADAFQAAHEKGIIHRDLKPANVKITPAGKIKVLDFGLAKAVTTDPGAADLSNRPTASIYETGAGMILGTAAYMSPEQVRGKTLDQRADIWAFGCCLYQALTGKVPFDGETTSDMIAAILNRQPDWEALPSNTQLAVRGVLRSCLQKDPILRPQNMTQIRAEIENGMAGMPRVRDVFRHVAGWRIRRKRLVWAIPAVIALAAGIAASLRLVREAPLPRLVNPVQVSAAIGVEDYPTWSPDGRTLAYCSNETGTWDIYVKQPGGGPAVNRTADFAGDDLYPSWSPDGRQIAFWSDREDGGYYVMSALGGGVQKITSNPHTGSFFHSQPQWSSDGSELAYVIYETGSPQFEASLEIVSMINRQSRRIRLPGMEQGRFDLSWSPDGGHVAYLMGVQYSDTTQLVVTNLQDGSTTPLTGGRTNERSPRWSSDGKYIYFVSNQGGTADVWRQPMSENGKADGDPQRITTAVGVSHIAFSADGKRMAYSQGRRVANVWRVPIGEDRARRPATWAEAEQVTFDLAFIEFVDVSPDGKQLAFSSDRSGNHDIWVMPIGGSQMRQLTFNLEPDWDPDWSPDGSSIAFYSYRTGDREI